MSVRLADESLTWSVNRGDATSCQVVADLGDIAATCGLGLLRFLVADEHDLLVVKQAHRELPVAILVGHQENLDSARFTTSHTWRFK